MQNGPTFDNPHIFLLHVKNIHWTYLLGKDFFGSILEASVTLIIVSIEEWLQHTHVLQL